MRKFISFIAAAAILAANTGTAISAADAAETDTAVAAIFDDAGRLVYSTHSVYTGTGESCTHTFVFPEEYEGMDVKYYGDCENPEYKAVYGETATEAPTVTPTETPTETAAAAPTAAADTSVPNNKPYPAVYERELDAVNAPAVVESSSETIVDGETMYAATMLYQGEMIDVKIRDSALIASAPSSLSDLEGSDASVLQKGDVIHFTCDLQGRIKKIDLIFRPSTTDFLSMDTQSCVGADNYSTYYFGIPINRTNGYMELYCPNGSVVDVDLDSETFVYTDNVSGRGKLIELAGTGGGAIIPTKLPDELPSWQEADPSAYVLARVCNGTATEVVQFENE